MNEVKLLIGGTDVASGSGATFERRSPITGEVVTRAAACTVADVNAAIEAGKTRKVRDPAELRARYPGVAINYASMNEFRLY